MAFMSKPPEDFRQRNVISIFMSNRGDKFGVFQIPSPDKSRITKTTLYVIASDALDGIEWEHVSVHAAKQFNNQFKPLTPTWDEMCYIKSLFWDAEDCVIQYHPPESKYVNIHKNVLHLYRPVAAVIPLPPIEAV